VARLRRPLEAIRELARTLEGQEDVELLHDPDTGILCFRLLPAGVPEENLDELQEHIYREILAGGRRVVSVTRLDGCAALRFVAVGPAVTAEAMLESVAEARRMAGK
jgi:glutamate/tyrosine decarboxylase-like PLP-dependent enzyme